MPLGQKMGEGGGAYIISPWKRVSRGLDVKWDIPSSCLDAANHGFSIGIHCVSRPSNCLWFESKKALKMGKLGTAFGLERPFCQIRVPPDVGLAPSTAGGPSPSTPPRTPPPTPDWAAPFRTPGALQKEPRGVGGRERERAGREGLLA